jgi:hypothetical protein
VTTAYGAKEGLPMTNFLPVLLWRPSPNSSGRHGMRGPHSLARLRGRVHDCAGGYEGSIRWFELSRSNVSAHYVVREDGGEATQMVNSPTVPATRALQSTLRRRRDGWLCESWFRRAFARNHGAHIRIFMLSFANSGSPRARWRRARHHLASDLGAAGGGHHDPSARAA